MEQKTLGLFIMSYGSPEHEKDLKDYYTHIRNGKVPTDEMMAELREKYEGIGGVSPLAKITKAQMDALASHLNSVQDQIEVKLYEGFKHVAPFIEDGVKKMKEDGIEAAVCLVLAPHDSKFNQMTYVARAKKVAEELNGPKLFFAKEWYHLPEYIDFWVNGIENILQGMSKKEQEKAAIFITAHSLPVAALKGCPYQKQVEHTAELIKEKLGHKNVYVAWQSAAVGSKPGTWLEPSVLDLTQKLVQEEGYTSIIYAPVGFVADHLEVLFDNDVECKDLAEKLGIQYFRPPMPNTDQKFIEGLGKHLISMCTYEEWKRDKKPLRGSKSLEHSIVASR